MICHGISSHDRMRLTEYSEIIPTLKEFLVYIGYDWTILTRKCRRYNFEAVIKVADGCLDDAETLR